MDYKEVSDKPWKERTKEEHLFMREMSKIGRALAQTEVDDEEMVSIVEEVYPPALYAIEDLRLKDDQRYEQEHYDEEGE